MYFVKIPFVLDIYDSMDIGHNLALWKTTNQSTYHSPKSHSSSMAVDGDSTVFGSNAYTMTFFDVGTWWQVDLEAVYEIRVVVITRKLEQCFDISLCCCKYNALLPSW